MSLARHEGVKKDDVGLLALTPTFFDIVLINQDVFSGSVVRVFGMIPEAVNHTLVFDLGASNETSASLESSFSKRFMWSPTFSTISKFPFA